MNEKWKRLLRRKRFWAACFFVLFLLTGYALRRPILRGSYDFLNVGRSPETVYDYGLILGGEPLDRPTAAAGLYRAGKVKMLICTGSQVPRALEAVGIQLSEAEATRRRLQALGIPDEAILMLPAATSTREEAEAIKTYFADRPRGNLLIITTETHTRRALSVFKEYAGPWEAIAAYGVAPTNYDSRAWWKNEFGFLAVFEEYLKLVYYWFAY